MQRSTWRIQGFQQIFLGNGEAPDPQEGNTRVKVESQVSFSIFFCLRSQQETGTSQGRDPVLRSRQEMGMSRCGRRNNVKQMNAQVEKREAIDTWPEGAIFTDDGKDNRSPLSEDR